MGQDKDYGQTLRKNCARHAEVMAMPTLLAIQKNSYQWFLDTGLREVFADVASITDYAGNLELSFLDYSMNEPPKYDVEECKARDATYAAPMKVSVRLHNKETGEIKEQEIFMGDFPLMTESGTFVINGAERVVVSQIVRSPGIYYGKEIDLKTDLPLLTSTVIPYRDGHQRGVLGPHRQEPQAPHHLSHPRARPQDRCRDPRPLRRRSAHRCHPREGYLQDL